MSERSPIFAVILAAGKGTRMKSNRAKVLHTLCGVSMVNYVIEATRPLVPEGLFVVVGHQADLVEAVLPEDAKPVLQKEQRGTGDAARAALAALEDEESGVLLVVNGDGTLISDGTLGELVERHSSAGVGATVLVAELEDPSGLGRVVEDAGVVRIVEERDATEYERQIRLVNLGIYAFRLSEIRDTIGGLTSENQGGELYLTDVLETIGRRSRAVTYRLKNPEEANLVNDRSQLARAEEILRRRILDAHMRDGVTVRDPTSTHIGAKVGAYCEVKNSRVGAGSKIPHLSYVGDAEIGADANLGAGTITANYDGENKHRTLVGDGVHTGVNTNLIAPVTVGEDAYTGAGSVVNKDVPAGKLAVGAPARAIRDSPQRRRKRAQQGGSARDETEG